MTREWYKENKHIVDAWADGRTIQWSRDGEKWYDFDEQEKIEESFMDKYFKYRIKPEVQYPIFARNKHLNIWVKFDDEHNGEVIGIKPTKYTTIPYAISGTIHTEEGVFDKSIWEIIPNPYELHDKDAVLVWSKYNTLFRYIAFYDEPNNTVFSTSGLRNW